MSFKVVHEWELRPAPPAAPQDFPVQGQSGLFTNLKYGWWTSGSYLEVRQLAPPKLVSSWQFGGVAREGPPLITSVTELSRNRTSLPLLLVALYCPVAGGLICVFDCFSSTVVRTVRIDGHITKMHVIDPGCTGCALPPSSPFKYLDGVVALGTLGGDVMLMDLYKQACDNSIGDLDRSRKDEVNPSTVWVVPKDKMADIKKYIERSVDRDQHVGVYLNDNPPQAERGEHFTLKGAEGEDIVHVDRSELEVSALYYSPQLGCLLVGYNFGAFQMWDLRNLKLRYTSPICEENIPITGFMVQEPADDPKAYCYVWVAYSHGHLYQRGLPFAVLYSFYFDRKTHLNGWGNLYEDFQHCSVRFQLELGNARTATNSARGGAFLHFQSVNRDANGLSLCQMSWWYWTATRECSTGVLVFDLNQWYKEQMPRVPNWNRCSNYMIKKGVEGLLLDVKMDEKSLVQFMGIQRLEEHFCPTSLSFDLWGVSHRVIVKIHNKGVQKEFLDAIATDRHLALMRPNSMFEEIANLGLVPLFYDLRNSTSLDQDGERELLFAVVLEHNIIEWTAAVALKIGDDSLKSCDLRATDLLRWALKRACAVKNALHAYCAPLFDHSGAALDENALRAIAHGHAQIRHVCTVYRHVTDKMAADAAVDEYVAELQSLDNLVVYFETLLWMTNVGLLPERRAVNAHDVTSAPYPVDQLTAYYDKRRAHLQLFADGERDCHLFIDSFIDHMESADVLRQQWQEDGGTGVYPPPSLQSVLRIYLLDDPPLRQKHFLVTYVMLDLAHLTEEPNKVAKLLKFPQRFDLSQSDQKIAQAFWHLDHERHADCLDAILDASVRADDLTQWQHRVMLTSLLAHDRASLALLYLRVRKPPIEEERDLRCHVSLLIARDLIDEAFAVRQQRKGRGERALLSHIFSECARSERLRALLYRQLNGVEERAFLRYLDETRGARHDDLRAVYYLMRARFLEAFDARRPLQDSLGLRSQQTVSVTDSVLQLFKRLLPDVNRALVELVRSERGNLWREHPRPAPFSVFVHDARNRVRYKSSVHLAALSKASETFDAERKMAPRIADTETTPFLKTPTAFRRQRERETPVLRTKVIEQDAEVDDGPTPRKRIKLSPRHSVKSASTNRNLLLGAAAQSALSTPIIKRSRASLQEGGATPAVAAPASILKARHAVTDHQFNADTSMRMEECENSFRPLEQTLRTPLKTRVKFDDARYSGSSLDASSLQEATTTTASVSDDAFYSPEPAKPPAQTMPTDDVTVFQDSPQADGDVTERTSKFDSPRSRRSYKRSYADASSPVRSSPRLNATTPSTTTSESSAGPIRSVNQTVTVTEETRYSFSLTEISESDISGLLTTSSDDDRDSSTVNRRVRARLSTGAFAKTRKSLARSALERSATKNATPSLFSRSDSNLAQLDSNFTQSDSNLSRMDSNLGQLESNFNQPDSNLSQIDSNFNQPDSNLSRMDSNLGQSESNLSRMDSNLGQSESNINQPDSNLSQIDSNFNRSDLNLSQSDSNYTQMDSNLKQSDLNLSQPDLNLSRMDSNLGQSDSNREGTKMVTVAVMDVDEEDQVIGSRDDVTTATSVVYDELSSASEDAQIVRRRLEDETSDRDHARFLDDEVERNEEQAAQDADVIEIGSSDDDTVSNRNASSSGSSTSNYTENDLDLDEINCDLPELEVNVIEEATPEDDEPVETRSISVQCSPQRSDTPDDAQSPAVPLLLRTVKKTYGRREALEHTPTPAACDDVVPERNVDAQSPDVLRLRSVRKTYGRNQSTDVEETSSRDTVDESAAARVTRRRSKSLGRLHEGEAERRQTRRILCDSALGEALLNAALPDEAEEASEQGNTATTAKKPKTTRKKPSRAGEGEPVSVTLTPSQRRRSHSVDQTTLATTAARGRYSRSKSVDVDADESAHGGQATRARPKKASKPSSEIGDYATSRRLTRRQASMLSAINPDRRLPIVDEIDPIDLLDKPDFTGRRDAQETKLLQLSPSTSSEASSRRMRSGARGRSTRSTTPTTVSGIKSRLRRTSTDAASGRSEATPSPPKKTKSTASKKRATRTRKLTEDLPAVEEEVGATETATQAGGASAKKRGRK